MACVALRPSPPAFGAGSSWQERKWADMLDGSVDDGSSDGEQEALVSCPPVVDDSYREAPVEDLEDSHSGLNLRLACLATPHSEPCQGPSTSEAPKDFEFLFHRLHSDQKALAPLNVDAPEFIPTLSHDCPVVGFCDVIPEHSLLSPLDDQGSAASSRPRSPRSWRTSSRSIQSNDEESEFGTPTRANSQPEAVPHSSIKNKCGSLKAKKRKVKAEKLGLKAPAMKRTKSEERREVHKGGPMEMPELSQEDWEHRCSMRQRHVAFGKATQEYGRYCDARQLNEDVTCEVAMSGLKTPDPLDRSMSKRQWKYIVQQWRNSLKRLHGLATDGGDTGSTASIDENLSVITGITDEADAVSTSCGDDGSNA